MLVSLELLLLLE